MYFSVLLQFHPTPSNSSCQNPSDPISYLCAWLALVPQALCIVYVTLIWSSREIEIILMFLGQLSCEALNFLLKRLIKQERPKQMYGKGYGMPSSHAQFVGFWAVALGLFLLLRHQPKARGRRREGEPLSWMQRVVAAAGAVGIAAAVTASRVYLNYHTVEQAMVGVGAGVFTAIVWFAATEIFRRLNCTEILLEIEVVKMLRIRDLVIEEDLPAAGWEMWRTRKATEKRD